MKRLTLTVNEIADLARFAGLVLDETRLPDRDEGDVEIAIDQCPESGLFDEECDTPKHYRFIAWLDEYPEEGSWGLGEEISFPVKETNK